MITTVLLLATALVAQAPASGTPGPIHSQSPTSSRTSLGAQQRQDLAAYRREIEKGLQSVLGGTFTTARPAAQVTVSPFPAPGVQRFVLTDTGTQWQESLLLGVPQGPITGPAPLLVMFHGFGVTEQETFESGYDLFQGALDRGWYVIAPLGAHQYNFGIPYAQANIEYALTLFSALLPIDPDRIYGAGFSMGGGGALSYAARHLDPGKPRFAAVLNHTGAVSTAFTYWNSTDTFVFDHPDSFGGSPADDPFIYSRSSCVDIDTALLAVDPGTDLARNLSFIPVLNYYAEFDPNANLILVTQIIFNWLGLIPDMETYLLTPPQAGHSWSTVDENTVLNYLGSKTLQVPTTGQHRVLADRDARWFHFTVTQDAPGAFTPFRWDFNLLANRLVLDETANLQHMRVDSAALGLNTAVNLEVVMATTDGTSETTTLSGYVLQPQEVLRDGVPTTDWVWDATAQTVTLTENNPGAAAVWKIRP